MYLGHFSVRGAHATYIQTIAPSSFSHDSQHRMNWFAFFDHLGMLSIHNPSISLFTCVIAYPAYGLTYYSLSHHDRLVATRTSTHTIQSLHPSTATPEHSKQSTLRGTLPCTSLESLTPDSTPSRRVQHNTHMALAFTPHGKSRNDIAQHRCSLIAWSLNAGVVIRTFFIHIIRSGANVCLVNAV